MMCKVTIEELISTLETYFDYNLNNLITMSDKIKIIKIRFDQDYIYGIDVDGNTYRQSLLWYPYLKDATDEVRAKFRIGLCGIHWPELDTDISFESFKDDDAEKI